MGSREGREVFLKLGFAHDFLRTLRVGAFLVEMSGVEPAGPPCKGSS